MTLRTPRLHAAARPTAIILGLWRLAAVVMLLAGATLSAQTMPHALQVPGGHRLWQVDEVTLTATPWPGAGALQFLSIELPGYAFGERLRADLPRLEQATGPAPHVRLPVEGSLYRVAEAGTTSLLIARGDGTLEILLAVTDNGLEPGLLADVAVSRAGSAALVATSVNAGGNVFYIDLTVGGGTIDLTLTQPPLLIASTSLRLGPDTTWFLGDGSLYRATLGIPPPAGETATVVPVTLGIGESLLDETVSSLDGQTLAVVSDDGLGNRTLHVAGTTGAAMPLTVAPAAFDLPSYGSPVGPFIALSNDGSQIAWRETLLLKKELFIRPTGLGGAAVQVTGDALFTDTIDNAGVLGFIGNDVLIFAAGEASLDGLGSADIFRVDLNVSTEPFNITQTSGQTTAPFTLKGTLDILGVTTAPTSSMLLVDVDPSPGDHEILLVPTDGVSPQQVVLTDLMAEPQLAPVGDNVLIFSEPDLPNFPRQVHLLSATGQLTLLASVPDAGALVIDRLTVNRAGTRAAFVASLGPGVELPGLVDVVVPWISPAWDLILGVSPQIAFSPTERLAVGVGVGGVGPYLWLGFTGPFTGVVYKMAVRTGFPLSL